MDEYDNTPKTILRPRNAGETIKKAQVVMKRRDRNLQANADRARKIEAAKKAKLEYKKGSIRIVRAEAMVRRHRYRMQCHGRIKTAKRKMKNKPVRGCRSILVARNGRNSGCKKIYKVLKSLGLQRRNSMVFLPNDKDTVFKLSLVRPNCFWGRVSHKTTLNLIQKRAKFRKPESEEPIALSDNALIEEHLGDQGILCTEDLVDVIFKFGPKFSEVTRKLWPFEIGDSRNANGLMKDRRFLEGAQEEQMDAHVSKLIGI